MDPEIRKSTCFSSARPVLSEEFVQASAPNMRGPPPRFTPPSPPLTDHLTCMPLEEDDDSQYETPDQSKNRLPRSSSGNNEKTSLITSSEMPFTSENNGNCYKQTPSLNSDEEKHQLLKQNPQTGSYFIPHSSHTTMSTLSPQSHREKSCTGRYRMQHYHQSFDGSHSNYEPFLKQNMISSNSSGGSSSTQSNLRPIKASIRRSNSSSNGVFSSADRIFCSNNSKNSSEIFYRRILFILVILILLLSLLVFYLFYSLRNVQNRYYYYDKTGSIYYQDINEKLPSLNHHSNSHLLLSLPEHFRLGELISGDLPPGQMVYTHFSVQTDDPVQFNISVTSKARIAIYARQTLKPTLTLHNYIQTIRGDHLHVAGIARRQKREENGLKSALVQFHLLPGKWFLGFFNDGLYPEPITFVANVVKKELKTSENKNQKTCKYDCFSKGICKNGKCHCDPGYSGEYCEETACPVLCNGNGIFSNGKCSCHDGYKGNDCDIEAHICLVTDCNKNGICGSDGTCHCDHGWIGEFCETKNCDDPNCSNNGICQNGTCYCAAGWYGDRCEQRISSACAPLKNNRFELTHKNYQTTLINRSKNDKTKVMKNDLLSIQKLDKQLLKQKDLKECVNECVHGYCDDGICICEPSYGGEDCSTKQCLPGCEKHGICNDGICECEQGWNGDNCYIEGCPNNCSGIGSCQQLKGIWQCVCDNQHFGKNCELTRESQCDDGIDNDDDGLIDCQDSECCLHSSCVNSPFCTSAVLPRKVLLSLKPSLDATFYNKNKFLIEKDSVQQYADAKLFNDSRVSVIHGRVLSSKGGPLNGVRISDVSNVRYGFSLSRMEDGGGTFDIMVNGGGYVTLQFLRQPYGKVERSFYIPANTIINVGEIIMNEPSISIVNKQMISDECQINHLEHDILPQFISSWLLNQYAGGIKSVNDFDTEYTKIIADARIVHEKIPIDGTNDMELIYNSDRSNGYKSSIYMALLPSTAPLKLRLVHVNIKLAGNEYKEILVAKPNLTHTFNWNHLNIYEQVVYGLTTATISIGYEYDSCNKNNEILWKYEQVKIEGRKMRKSTLGLWTFNFHHTYDFLSNVLERGDGLTDYLNELPPVLKTLIGTNEQRELTCDNECNYLSLDDIKLFQPNAITIANDGTIYVGDYNLIRKINSEKRKITTVLKLKTTDIVHSYYLATDPFTNELYVSIPLKRQIWKLKSNNDNEDFDPSTNYKIVVGDGSICGDENGSCGDRGLAENSQLTFPKDITFDKFGNLYMLDGRKIRYVTKEKQINTLYKSPEWKPSDNCSPVFKMNELNLEWPMSIIFEPLSSEFIILDTDVIYRLNIETGIVRVLAGTKKGCTVSSHGTHVIENVQAIALSPINGQLYIAESDSKRTNLIRSMPVNGGQLKIVAGRTSKCDCDKINCPCDDKMNKNPIIATQSLLHKPISLAVDSHGDIYVADQANYKIKIIEKIKAFYDYGTRSYKINSPGTNEIYYFNKYGMHQKTVNLLNGQETYIFKYSADTNNGKLIEIINNDGSSLKLTQKNESKIILEGAKKTIIHQNEFDKELIDSIESMSLNGKEIKFKYNSEQLLKSIDINNKIETFDYDISGRVTLLSKSTGEVYSFSSEYQLKNYLTTDVLLNGRRFKRFLVDKEGGNYIKEDNEQNYVKIISNDNIMNIQYSNGIKNSFEALSHPLIEPRENVYVKRKITINDDDSELNSRFEWRSYVKAGRGSQIEYIGRRPRVR